jgi:hypothetical protein
MFSVVYVLCTTPEHFVRRDVRIVGVHPVGSRSGPSAILLVDKFWCVFVRYGGDLTVKGNRLSVCNA